MNLDNRKVLCMIKGGSHAYGLSTPTSDIDLRGVFVNTDASHLVGLKRDEVLTEQNKQHDKVMTEFRHVLKLLRNANSQMVELLYMNEYEVLDPFWEKVKAQRQHLVESKTLFNCLRGYMQGELRLANGERTGKLGGKRKEAIDKYGFSPKNFVQLFRLAWAGKVFFQDDGFPVDLGVHNPSFRDDLLDIKVHPEKYTKEQLNERAAKAEVKLVESYETRRYERKFDEEVADNLCLRLYGPLIECLFRNY